MNDEMRRRIEVAATIATVVVSMRALVTELRRGRRAHAGQAALRVAAALVGMIIAVRELGQLEEGEA